MSEVTIPLLAPEPPAATPISFSKEEANYFLYTLDFYRTVIHDVLSKVPPLELVFILAFIQAAIETQIPEAGEAFGESRVFFKSIYPALLQNERGQHPDLPEDGLLIVVPTPLIDGVAQQPFADEPRIVTPGSRLVM